MDFNSPFQRWVFVAVSAVNNGSLTSCFHLTQNQTEKGSCGSGVIRLLSETPSAVTSVLHDIKASALGIDGCTFTDSKSSATWPDSWVQATESAGVCPADVSLSNTLNQSFYNNLTSRWRVEMTFFPQLVLTAGTVHTES